MSKIGFLGGAFDPVHNGHLIIAKSACAELGFEQVLFIPLFTPPHKEPALLGPRERLELVRLAIAGNPCFAVDECEIRRGGISYTVDTVMDLKRRHPEAELYCVIGSDGLSQLHTWKEPRRLLSECVFAVARRPGVGHAALHPDLGAFSGRIVEFDCSAPDISSSSLRSMIRAEKSIRYLVPPAVETCIIKNKYYA